MRDALHRFSGAALLGEALRAPGGDVLRSLLNLLPVERPRERVGSAQGIDSRIIVRECIRYVSATRRIPSLSELCTVAKVSERRLRSAFTDEFDQPPTRFFRTWALEEAHRRLRVARPEDLTVTRVALDLGFEHLGRFAGHYRGLYGEPPSATLRATDRLAS